MRLLREGRSPWARGKALGGSSVINAMIYMRGHREDYDGWEAEGNPGWGWDDILPFFKKSEAFKGINVDEEYHGTSGPMEVMVAPYAHPFSTAVVEAADELGMRVDDINGRGQDGGFAYTQLTLERGWRY